MLAAGVFGSAAAGAVQDEEIGGFAQMDAVAIGGAGRDEMQWIKTRPRRLVAEPTLGGMVLTASAAPQSTYLSASETMKALRR